MDIQTILTSGQAPDCLHGVDPVSYTHLQSEYLMGKEAGTILKHQIETRDPQVTRRVMSPLLEVRKSTRAIVL